MIANGIAEMPRVAAALLFVLLIVLGPLPARSQQTVVPLQLSFSDPGARSAGLGGAFVALADDATAAFANPAGLGDGLLLRQP